MDHGKCEFELTKLEERLNGLNSLISELYEGTIVNGYMVTPCTPEYEAKIEAPYPLIIDTIKNAIATIHTVSNEIDKLGMRYETEEASA